MSKFNLLKSYQNTALICQSCGYTSDFKTASDGCPRCNHHLLVVSQRGNTPRGWDPDKQDPYLRQKQGPMDHGHGGGDKLTQPADEQWSGGFGTREREGFPQDYSSTSNSEQDVGRMREKLPTEETHIDNPPTKDYEVQEQFVDPTEPLSSSEQIRRNEKGWDRGQGYSSSDPWGGTLDSKLRGVRNTQSLKPKDDDDDKKDIYDNIRSKQKKGT